MTGDEEEAEEKAFVLVDVVSYNGTKMLPGADGQKLIQQRGSEPQSFIVLELSTSACRCLVTPQ